MGLDFFSETQTLRGSWCRKCRQKKLKLENTLDKILQEIKQSKQNIFHNFNFSDFSFLSDI
jgi:hypothetical protein